MRGLLEHLRTTYSDLLQPLVDAGLSPGLVDALRRGALALRGTDLSDRETEQRCRRALDMIWRGMEP